MDEIWKDIIGYEGLYQVSNMGNVRSLNRLVKYNGINKIQEYPSILLKPCLNSVGYYQVSLSINNNRKRFMVHRLVAAAFCFRDKGKDFVNHIDGDYLNNKYSNLEWVTVKENARHAIATGLHKIYGEDSCKAKFSNSQVAIIRKLKNSGISTKDLTILLKVHKSCIDRIVNGKTYNINNRIKSYKDE